MPFMKACLITVLVLIGVVASKAQNEKQAETSGTIVRANPALAVIVPPGAQLEKLTDGCKWTEGPV